MIVTNISLPTIFLKIQFWLKDYLDFYVLKFYMWNAILYVDLVPALAQSWENHIGFAKF